MCFMLATQQHKMASDSSTASKMVKAKPVPSTMTRTHSLHQDQNSFSLITGTNKIHIFVLETHGHRKKILMP